jgi:putative membrane protein
MMYPHYYYGGGFFGFGIWPFLIILGVIFLIWAIFAHRHNDTDEEISDEIDTALEILKKRYAKGEITKKEFLEMKKDIA